MSGTVLLMQEQYDTLLALLKRAAEKLQDYCAETDGERNDPLAMEIELELKAEKPLRMAWRFELLAGVN